nr:MAG TPA: hypothetical protein [Caudoviricetes sp.]
MQKKTFSSSRTKSLFLFLYESYLTVYDNRYINRIQFLLHHAWHFFNEILLIF